MDLAQNLQPVAALIGTWEGEGVGSYPTIESFRYREELIFNDIGKPFLQYEQRSWNPEGKLMHVETGYLRVTSPTSVELIVAIPTGQSEAAEGSLSADDQLRIELTGRILNTSSAKHVEATERVYVLDGDTLSSTFNMAAVDQEMTLHLESTMHRSPDGN